MYVPETRNPADGYDEPASRYPLSITVHPPETTKRPIGFAPWPKQSKKKKKKG